MEINEIVELLYKQRGLTKKLDDFCREKFIEKFPNPPPYGYRIYDGFDVLTEHSVSILYMYGEECEYRDEFTIIVNPKYINF